MKRGISLVALVITIIVLIILTATVMIMFNNGGIADKAEEAVFNTNFTTLIEMTTMANNDYMLENLGTEKITTEDVRSALQKYDSQNLLNRDVKGFKCYELLQIYEGKLYQTDMVEQNDKELSDKLTALGIETLFKEYVADKEIFRFGNEDQNGNVFVYFRDDIVTNENLKELRIPNVIYDDEGNKHYITEIGKGSKYLYQAYPNLEKVIVSKGVVWLNNNIFINCSNLKTVVLPNTLRYLTYGTFANCSSLENITLPNNLGLIGDYVFQGCTNLKEITIPNSVYCLGRQVFLRCSSGLTIEVDNTKARYDSDPGNINTLWNNISGALAKTIYTDCIVYPDGTIE